jgi:hypothetical protein
VLVGRPPSSTAAERVEVFRLADAGLSHGTIAEQVFGDRRFRLRVLRLLRRRGQYEQDDATARRLADEFLRSVRPLDETDREFESFLARIIAEGG